MLNKCRVSTVTQSCYRFYFQSYPTSGSVVAEAIRQVERVMNPRVFKRRSLIFCQKTGALGTFIVCCPVTHHDQKRMHIDSHSQSN